jgi:hypothetical protein
MKSGYDLLEEKLREIGVPYAREGNDFSTNLIFDDTLQKYAKLFNLVKNEEIKKGSDVTDLS